MKLLIAILLSGMVFGSLAFAVSIDFTTFAAVKISELETTVSEDGLTKSTNIEFSGNGLRPLMALLPKVTEEGKRVKNLRMFSITNAGQEGVEEDETTAIFFECRTEENTAPTCGITIFKGVIPG